MISGRRSLVRGRVTEPGEFLELSAESLRSLVAKDAELSEIFMRAFILRRLELIRTGQGNVILMASRHSANALRLREFLTRNEHPYTYIDLDTDKIHRNCSIVLTSSWTKFRWSFAAPARCCEIPQFENWPSAWG